MSNVPGAYLERPNPEDPQIDKPARTVRPPQPGEESVGPALTDLVLLTRNAVAAMEALWQRARRDAQYRELTYSLPFATDANGDAGIMLYEVPQGARAHLMLLGIDQAGRTPAAPDTAATLWHAIYAGGPGASRAADVVRVGAMLDASPLTPAADAQIPFVYTYGDRVGAPTLHGPQCFYLVIDGATASVQHSARVNILVSQPEE